MSDAAPGPERPIIAQYTDYRAYLRAMIAHLKVARRGFSYRSFALKAGFASPSFLKLVAEGQRNLSNDSVERVAQGLGLDRRELEAFEALVELAQAGSDAKKNRAYAKVAKMAQRDPVRRLETDQLEAYSSWFVFVLRELAGLPDFCEDPEWLASRLRFKVRPEEVKRGLDVLERLELLVRDEDGRLQPKERNLTSGPEVRTLAVRNFHRGMLERAIQSLDLVPVPQRNITGVTVSLNRRQYARVVELVQTLRAEVLAVAEATEPDDEPPQVHQLTFALVPLTQERKS